MNDVLKKNLDIKRELIKNNKPHRHIDILIELWLAEKDDILKFSKKRVNYSGENDNLSRAKAVPVTNYIKFKRNTAPCIWHDEKEGSMHYYPQTNSVYCFGCNKYGDTIDVVEQLFGLTTAEAIKKINEDN